MQNWLKRSLLVITVFGICWIGAVWYWRSTTRMPDTGDLALAMLAMPLSLLAVMWLAHKSLTTARTPEAQAPAVAEALPVQGAAQAGAQWQPMGIAGAALRMPHGDSPAELAAAMAEGEARLDLDPELTDLQGFPMLAGRVPEVDLEPLLEWISAQQPAARMPGAEQLRAMALGGDIATELAARATGESTDGVLQLLPLLPANWPAATQELATRWLVHCAVSTGWPQERLTMRHLPPGASPLAALRDLAAQSSSASAPALSMLLACDSSIDADAVEQLAVNGKLYGPRNPNGRMPAEGAAGVLLQPAKGAARDALRLLALQAGDTGHDAPADAAGKTTLTALAKEVLEQAGGPEVAYIAADTDHRAAAMSDLMNCVEAHAPELDANTSLACIGAACGHTGAAGAIAAIALAHEQAADSGGTTLCLANGDPTQRFALLLGRLPAPASSAPTLS